MAKDKSKKGAAGAQKDAGLKLVADAKSFDAGLASLFAKPVAPAKPLPKEAYHQEPKQPAEADEEESDEADEVDDEDLSSIDEEIESDDDDDDENEDVDGAVRKPVEEESEEFEIPVHESLATGKDKGERKRKRKAEEDDLEDKYMRKLAKEEAKEEAERKSKRSKKRLKKEDGQAADQSEEESDQSSEEDEDAEMEDASEPSDDTPQKSLKQEDAELDKAARTVFVANVSTAAIKEKSAEKIFTKHMSSFLSELPSNKPPHKLESHRFRSTPFAASLPKKAAYVTKDIMDATAHSTNAYVVYSTQLAAREAARRLNGTVVLERHIRVDSVAHPAKADHKRCVFVGNLGFVDDESIINEAEAKRFGKTPQKKKQPSDVEEGLWREFGKCGTVESVRVVRDPKTRVGKGFAYVQFTDENGVEAALLFNEKKFPPMLPRKLRVTRAKPFKRSKQQQQSSSSTRPATGSSRGVYNPKISAEQKSLQGRAAKLLGKAGAAKLNKNPNLTELGESKRKSGGGDSKDAAALPGGAGAFKTPEAFVFEGYRASAKQGKTGLKLGGAKKGGKSKGGKPASRGSKRAAAWKKGGGKK
ncbi:hypothetical protein HDK77DRAFT_500815 [Phyllosticta capitalensis]